MRFFFEFFLFDSDGCWRFCAECAKVAVRTEGVGEAAATVAAIYAAEEESDDEAENGQRCKAAQYSASDGAGSDGRGFVWSIGGSYG
jgi:hypothetical protein